MRCPRCGSDDVVVQAVVEHHIVDAAKKRHGFLWWLAIGLWWVPLCFFVKWVVFTPVTIAVKLVKRIFGIKPHDISNEKKAKAVCQVCGHVWDPR